MIKLILLKLLKIASDCYLHKKTGNKYYVLFISNEYSGRVGFPKTVVYVSEQGIIYSRPVQEFNEKFIAKNKPTVFPI